MTVLFVFDFSLLCLSCLKACKAYYFEEKKNVLIAYYCEDKRECNRSSGSGSTYLESIGR